MVEPHGGWRAEVGAAGGSAAGAKVLEPGGVAGRCTRSVLPLDPRLVPSLPGPPPRQASSAAKEGPAASPSATIFVNSDLPAACTRTTRSAGVFTSALLHFAALLGLSLLVGPLHLGTDTPVELDLAVPPVEAVAELMELDLAEEPVATEFAQVAEVPPTLAAADAPLMPRGHIPTSGGSGPSGTFFGTTAYGNRFVYVLDVSSSMGQMRDRKNGINRLRCAINELLYSVDKLTADQYFYVVLFSYSTRQMFDEPALIPQMVPATPDNKRRLRAWLAEVQAESGTDPRAALQLALRMRPSAMFLLSDGEFNGQRNRNNRNVLHGNPSVEDVVSAANHGKSPIHTIALEDPVNRRRLEALSADTGGEFRYIPPLGSRKKR